MIHKLRKVVFKNTAYDKYAWIYICMYNENNSTKGTHHRVHQAVSTHNVCKQEVNVHSREWQ